MSRLSVKLLRWIVAVVILGFLFRILIGNWQAVDASGLKWNFVAAAVALALLVVLQNLFVAGWVIILKGMKLALPWRRAFVIFHESQVMRFVPGNVWHVVGRTYMAAEDGLPAPAIFASMFLENALLLLSSLAVFGLALPFWSPQGHVPAIVYFGLIPPLMAVMYPPVLNRLLNFALRVLRRPQIQLNLPYRTVLLAAAYQCFVRICAGICLYVTVLAVFPLPASSIPALVGMHALSYVIGFVSFITPGGLGFREAALAFFLTMYMPSIRLPDAVMIALFARLLWTLSEFVNAGIAVLIGRNRRLAEAEDTETTPTASASAEGLGDKPLEMVPKIINYRLARRGWIKPAMPINLTLSVTNACQSRCKTCNIWATHRKSCGGDPARIKDELTLAEIEKTFKSIGHVYFMNISGGEPFLRADLPEIVNIADRELTPAVIHIPTNALLPARIEKMTSEMLQTLSRNGRGTLLTVKPSFDGIGTMHDDIRGVPGNFEKLTDTLGRLHELKMQHGNLEVGLGTVISSYNADQIEKLAEFAHSQGVDSYISEIAELRSEMFNMNEPITPSADDYERAIGLFSAISRKNLAHGGKLGKMTQSFRLVYYDMVVRTLKERRQTLPCYGGISNAHISPYGDVWACCVLAYEQSMGNLRDSDFDFRKVWFSERAAEVRKHIASGTCWCPLANQAYSNILCSPTAMMKVLRVMLRNGR